MSLHFLNSKMNPCSGSSAIHIYVLVDYFLSYIFSISDKDKLARHFCKSLWQYFLNIIRLIALKMRWLLCIQKQNIYGNWRGLRSLTINQQLDKKAFAWITGLFCNIKGLRKRMRNAKFYFQFRLHNLLRTNYDFLH